VRSDELTPRLDALSGAVQDGQEGEHAAGQGDGRAAPSRAPLTGLSSGVPTRSASCTPAARPDAARRGFRGGGPRDHAPCSRPNWSKARAVWPSFH
jgi:hypothetical protein